MIKCTRGQVRRLKTALRWKIPLEQRQRIQMVLLRESGMTQPLIAAAMASASRSSFFWAFTYGRTYSGDISRTSCPRAAKIRPSQ